jgi:hypothetical protein
MADQNNALALQYLITQHQQRIADPMNELAMRTALEIQRGVQVPWRGSMQELRLLQQLQPLPQQQQQQQQ